MSGLIDFDREYMLFAAKRLSGKGEIKDEEMERALNDTMTAWLGAKSDALGGKTPDEYFADMTPDELVSVMIKYATAGMSVPEPLYRRISKTAECAPYLAEATRDGDICESARASALRLSCDLGGDTELCADMMAQGGALQEIAAEWLSRAGYKVVDALIARYETAPDAILDVLCGYPGIVKIRELLIRRLYDDTQNMAMHAAQAAKLGDPELIEPLMRLSQFSDITYFDYKEIVNAIDALGGDAGEERQFYGDPDYEAMMVADTMPEDL